MHEAAVDVVHQANVARAAMLYKRMIFKALWKHLADRSDWGRRIKGLGGDLSQASNQSYAAKRALKKWSLRHQLNKKCRDRVSKFRSKRRLIYLRATFHALRSWLSTARALL